MIKINPHGIKQGIPKYSDLWVYLQCMSSVSNHVYIYIYIKNVYTLPLNTVFSYIYFPGNLQVYHLLNWQKKWPKNSCCPPFCPLNSKFQTSGTLRLTTCSGGSSCRLSLGSLGVSLNDDTPISHPKSWSFLVGKPMGLLGKPTILGNPHLLVGLLSCSDSQIVLVRKNSSHHHGFSVKNGCISKSK